MIMPPGIAVSAASSSSMTSYRLVDEDFKTNANSLVVQATWFARERKAMITSDQLIRLSGDMWDYLADEAQRRGVGIEEVYREEMMAKKELAKITPPNADLLRIADRFPAPQTWYDE